MNKDFDDLLAAMKQTLTEDSFENATTKLAHNIEARIVEKATAILTEEVSMGVTATKTILSMMGRSADCQKLVLEMQHAVTVVAMAKAFISVGIQCIAGYPEMKQDIAQKLGKDIFELIASTMDTFLESIEDKDTAESEKETNDCPR